MDLDRTEVVKAELIKGVDRVYQNQFDQHWMVKKVSDIIQDKGGFRGNEATTYELIMAFDGTASAYATSALQEGHRDDQP